MCIPFVAAVKFVPVPSSRHWEKRLMFADRAIDGISLGWEMDVGCKFHGK